MRSSLLLARERPMGRTDVCIFDRRSSTVECKCESDLVIHVPRTRNMRSNAEIIYCNAGWLKIDPSNFGVIE